MLAWNLSDGILSLNSKNIVKNYSHETSRKVIKLIEESFSGEIMKDEYNYSDEFLKYKIIKEKEYRQIYLAQLDYQIKCSKDNRYCAVYSNTGIHCDFYEQFPSRTFEKGVYLFTLVKSTFYPSEWIVDFILHPETKNTLCLFGSKHRIEFYDMKGVPEEAKITIEDLYFKNIEWINDYSFLIHGWDWGPSDHVLLCDIEKFFKDSKNYCIQLIWSDDDWEKYPKVKDGKIWMGNNLYTDIENIENIENIQTIEK